MGSPNKQVLIKGNKQVAWFLIASLFITFHVLLLYKGSVLAIRSIAMPIYLCFFQFQHLNFVKLMSPKLPLCQQLPALLKSLEKSIDVEWPTAFDYLSINGNNLIYWATVSNIWCKSALYLQEFSRCFSKWGLKNENQFWDLWCPHLDFHPYILVIVKPGRSK